MIDDQRIHRSFARFEPQAELFLERGEYRGRACSTRISNRPAIPVLSITGRSTTIRSVLENSSTVAPLASTEDDIPPLIRLPQYFLPG
jgi:hypothetical protein